MYTHLKELESTINATEREIAKKENNIKIVEAETQATQRRLQIMSGNE